jgi:hypothetical protein
MNDFAMPTCQVGGTSRAQLAGPVMLLAWTSAENDDQLIVKLSRPAHITTSSKHRQHG